MGFFDFLKKPKLSLEDVIAADMGDAKAKERLEKAFDKGMTSEEHSQLRWQAYRVRANQGNAFAQYWLGLLYSIDERNAELAIHWYELAANQGNVDAMKDLSLGYGEFLNTAKLGYGPVPFGYDEQKELYWLKMAADNGDEKSKQELKDRGYF